MLCRDGYTHPDGISAQSRAGPLDELIGRNPQPKLTTRFTREPFTIRVHPRTHQFVRPVYCLCRDSFDWSQRGWAGYLADLYPPSMPSGSSIGSGSRPFVVCGRVGMAGVWRASDIVLVPLTTASRVNEKFSVLGCVERECLDARIQQRSCRGEVGRACARRSSTVPRPARVAESGLKQV